MLKTKNKGGNAFELYDVKTYRASLQGSTFVFLHQLGLHDYFDGALLWFGLHLCAIGWYRKPGFLYSNTGNWPDYGLATPLPYYKMLKDLSRVGRKNPGEHELARE